MGKIKSVFLVWGKYQSRSETMKTYFNYEIKYFNSEINNLLLRYLLYSIQTFYYLLRNRPKTIWVQVPPSPLMHIVRFYSLFNNVTVIYDCHNAIFRKPWINTPFTKHLLKKGSNKLIVHNEDVKSEYNHLIPNDAMVLLDKPFVESTSHGEYTAVKKFNLENTPYIILPASFNSDEPIEEILDLENKLNSSFKLVITGNYKKKINNTSKYKSIMFTGWITSEEYKELFLNAAIVLGLTKYNLIQLSAANEGLMYKIPMVLSNTNTLKMLFPKGSLFTDNNSDSMANNLNKMFNNLPVYQKEIKELAREKELDWKSQAKVVKDSILEVQG